MEILVALDAGTSSVRAVAFYANGEVIAIASRELTVRYPRSGWVEQDPDEITHLCTAVLAELDERLGSRARDVVAIGLTNQRESVVAWDRADARVLYPLISWQDSRGAELCASLVDRETMIRSRTGLGINPYFSASKMAWLHTQGHLKYARQAAVSTLDSYLLWVLSGAKPDSSFVTDVSNASRTMLMDLDDLDFHPELLESFAIARENLPEVVPSGGVAFAVAGGLPFAGVPIAAVLGDQQASLLGQGCVAPGDIKNTYGSGSFVLANTGTARTRPDGGVLESVAWKVAGGEATYCLEGSIFSTGTILRWLRDNLGILSDYQSIDAMASAVRSSEGVVLIPSFQGLGAPYWDPHATGSIFGISQSTRPEHLVRSAIEGIALRTQEVIEAMEATTGERFAKLVIDGGLSRSDVMCQIQADQLQIPVVRSVLGESTARGAAMLAGVSLGVFSSVAEIPAPHQGEAFAPKASAQLAKGRRELWKRYLCRVLN